MTDLGARSVAVVGGGAAGLSAGYWLRRSGLRVRVYEAGPRPGGRCVSVHDNGFVFDLAAGALPATYAQTRELISALGLSDQVDQSLAALGEGESGSTDPAALEREVSALLDQLQEHVNALTG